MSDRVRIGISSCLLGEPVRWDGGHKRNALLVDELGSHVEWVPVCPEIELGLGAPRKPMQLERVGDGVRLVVPESGTDLTEAMESFARSRVRALEAQGLAGYVLKSNSPSCGMEHVPVYGVKSAPSRTGRGLFARALMDRWPNLPVEEEGRLDDPLVRENFLERVFAYDRQRKMHPPTA
jgi:uncharacterized protein YbbK (DUF523 family)